MGSTASYAITIRDGAAAAGLCRGGMAGLILLKMLAKTHQPMELALTGVALSACWASLTDYLMLLHPQDVNSALLWLTG